MLRPILASNLWILFVTSDSFSKNSLACVGGVLFAKYSSLDLLDYVLLFMVIVSHV
jgi:hypothetical protein